MGERSHDLSRVRLDDSAESGNGSRGNLRGKESEDTKHSKTAVVDLGTEAGLLLLLAHVLG